MTNIVYSYTGTENNGESGNFVVTLPGVSKPQLVFLDEKILDSLNDAYLGVQGVLLDEGIGTLDVNPEHQAYFKAFLKENSIKNVLEDQPSLSAAYESFCKNHTSISDEQRQKKNWRNLINFSSKSNLSEEDALFFNNLGIIRKYVNAEHVNGIGAAVDQVIAHRETYETVLTYSVPARGDRLKQTESNNKDASSQLRIAVAKGRIAKLSTEFDERYKSNYGTLNIIPELDNYIDEIVAIGPQLGLNIAEVKKRLFNVAANIYTEVISNPDVNNTGIVVKSFNDLHQRLFDEPMEMVKIVPNGGSVRLDSSVFRYAQ